MTKKSRRSLVVAVLFFCAAASLMIGCGEISPLVREKSIKKDLPFLVGSRTIFVHDFSRPFDKVAGIDIGVRTLITEIWYPVDKDYLLENEADYRRATYGDYVFGNLEVHNMMMTATTFHHLTPNSVRDGVKNKTIEREIKELFDRERMSLLNAPAAKLDEPFPVILMSHGDAGSRYNMESVCEFLAAHGYVVVAPEHTGNSPYAMIGADPALYPVPENENHLKKMQQVLGLLDKRGVYGAVENFGQTYSPISNNEDAARSITQLELSLMERVNDLRAVLNELEQKQESGMFEGRLDLSRVGLMGRSFGALTTLIGLAMEDRFTAGMAVVGIDMPTHPGKFNLGGKGSETVIDGGTNVLPATDFRKPTFLLNAAEDALIISLSTQRSIEEDVSLPTKANPHPGLRRAYERSTAPVVWGMLADANHASFAVSGPYWWPELKPKNSTRYFSGEAFELISSELAHEIQREAALAFFNLSLRGSRLGAEFLLSQPYLEQGFDVEARHLDSLVNAD